MQKKKWRKNKRKNENKDQTIIKTRINIKKKKPKAHAQLANRHFCPLNMY